MSKNFLLLLLFPFFCTSLLAQDFIIRVDQSFDTVKCKVISYAEDAIAYKIPDEQELKYINTTSISKWIFNPDEDELIYPTLIFDTLSCTIDSITTDNVFYHTNEGKGTSQSISKSAVFSCHFNNSATDDKLQAYQEKVQQSFINSCGNRISTIVTKNGRQLNVVKLKSIEGKSIYFEMYTPNGKVTTKINRDEVASYIFNEFDNKLILIQKSNYLHLTSGKYVKCIIKKIGEQVIDVDIVIMPENELVSSYVQKTDIKGVYFSDYESGKDLQTKKYKTDRNFDFNLKAGMGYMFSRLDEDIPSELIDYSNKLKSGFNFDINLNYYFSYYSGFGVTYKYFYTSNTIERLNMLRGGIAINSAKDRITIMFLGINYLYSTSPNKPFVYDFSIAPGIFSYHNNASVNNEQFKVTGFNYGINISNRICLNTKGSLGVFLDFSIFTGYLKNYTIEDLDFETETADNFSRFEVGLGIKIN